MLIQNSKWVKIFALTWGVFTEPITHIDHVIISQVGLDFTMIGVKEDKMKELNVHPFDLTPTVVAEDDQLVIPQHPLTRDYKQPTPLGISLGPCKKILGNLSCALFIIMQFKDSNYI